MEESEQISRAGWCRSILVDYTNESDQVIKGISLSVNIAS